MVVVGGVGGWCAKSFLCKTQTYVKVRLSSGWVGVLTIWVNFPIRWLKIIKNGHFRSKNGHFQLFWGRKSKGFRDL